MNQFLDINGLRYFTKLLKEYIDIKVELTHNRTTNCPNCGAMITGMKCEYCGTDFEAIMRIGSL